MSVWQVFKISRKTFFNPSAWFDVASFKEGNRAIYDSVNGLFKIPEAKRTETFEQAVTRMGLSEETLQRRQTDYYNFALILFILGVIVILFSLYLLFFHFSLSGFIIGIPAAGLFLAQAFKYHFWSFQIKHRKLGCTFAEWRRGQPFDQGSRT
ncbi:MAG: hypothetical protein H0W64_07915 [Gammaproteobacteria bacterium]|nr:hypothetical protein [Gammaproteobacteria bacterium]